MALKPRVIASNGYSLIRVGKNHHLADCRGYAYEHRLVAEKKLGRRLKKGEIVHHMDGSRRNNHPGNIQVLKSAKYHRALDRRPESKQRLPHERNPLVKCACGCGLRFRRFDTEGRWRNFCVGHSDRHCPSQDAIMAQLASGNKTYSQLRDNSGLKPQAVKDALRKMIKWNRIEKISRGIYGKKD